jgi:tetratricopeptide (TPR) repeat protein
MTRRQIDYWRDSETLFQHALEVTENNQLAHYNLGVALEKKGQVDEAIRQYQETIRLKPDYVEARNNLGAALLKRGQVDEAIRLFQETARREPANAYTHNNLGIALCKKGQMDEAINQFQEAIRLKPDYAMAHYNLGSVLAMKGRTDAAINQFQEAIRLKPDSAEAHYGLSVAFANKGQVHEANDYYQEALRLTPGHARAPQKLGSPWTESPTALGAQASTLDAQGKYAEAIRLYQAALKAQPDQEVVQNNLAWLLATCPDAGFRDGPEAVRLATRACELTSYAKPLLIGTLAAAQAEAGDFQAAIATGERAAALADTLRLEEVAAKNRELIQLYRQGQAFHEKR